MPKKPLTYKRPRTLAKVKLSKMKMFTGKKLKATMLPKITIPRVKNYASNINKYK